MTAVRRREKHRAKFDKAKFDRTKFRATLVAVLILCSVSAGSKLLPASERLLDRFDMAVYDLVLKKLTTKPSSVNDIVSVPITDGGLEFFRTKSEVGWPWPRQFYTRILSLCKAGGAKALFLDLLFTDPSPYNSGDDDAQFAENIKDWPHLYLLGEFRPTELEGQVKDASFDEYVKKFSVPVTVEHPLPKPREVKTIRFPVADIPGAVARICDPMIPTDIDGKHRRYNIITRMGDRYFLSPTAAMIWDIEGNLPIVLEKGWLRLGNHRIPIDDEGTMLLKYYGEGFRVFKTYEAHLLMQAGKAFEEGKPPGITPEELKDKIVIVGNYMPGVDMKDTPVHRFFPGMEIGAVAAANILADDYMMEMPKIWVILMTLFYMATSCFTFRYIKPFLCKYALYGFIGIHATIAVVAFKHDVWVAVVPQAMGILSSYITSIALNYVYEGKQKQLVKKTFQSYVSPAVVNKILAKSTELNLQGEKKLLTVLFLDIEGFTTMSEKMSPEDAVALLNRCFTRFGNEIFATEGNIDKFVGDAVIAFWGDPLPMADHASRACRSAVAIQKAMKDLNAENNSHLNIRVGVNTAEVTVGNMGSEKQMNYTVIGDGVNFASRLEGANKEFGTKILISESTYAMAKDAVEVREVGLVKVKGKELAVRIYEVIGEKGKVDDADREFTDLYQRGLTEFRSGRYREARDLFEETTRKREKPDKLARMYADVSAEFVDGKTPAPAGEYIVELKTK